MAETAAHMMGFGEQSGRQGDGAREGTAYPEWTHLKPQCLGISLDVAEVLISRILFFEDRTAGGGPGCHPTRRRCSGATAALPHSIPLP